MNDADLNTLRTQVQILANRVGELDMALAKTQGALDATTLIAHVLLVTHPNVNAARSALAQNRPDLSTSQHPREVIFARELSAFDGTIDREMVRRNGASG